MQCQLRPLLSARRHLVLAVSLSPRPPALRSARLLSTPSNVNDPHPHPILSELQRKGATSPSGSATSGPHLGPFPLPNIDESQARQARIDASSRQWSQLGVAQRAGVVATQGASLVVVLAGAGLFALVAYAFGSELFSEASPTRVFEDCVERVKQDHEVRSGHCSDAMQVRGGQRAVRAVAARLFALPRSQEGDTHSSVLKYKFVVLFDPTSLGAVCVD